MVLSQPVEGWAGSDQRRDQILHLWRAANVHAPGGGGTFAYLHGDHLGSVSLTTGSSGARVSEARYRPYGQERWSSGGTPTDFGFTGQRQEAGFGLMDYNARYYSSQLGRWLSPDTIVPDPANPQNLNRYSYVYNNPIRYYDSDGHCFPFCLIAVAVSVYRLANASSPGELTVNSRAIAEANIPVVSSIAAHDAIGTEEAWQAYHGVDTEGNALSSDQRSWLAQDAAGHVFQATMEIAATALAVAEFTAVAQNTIEYYKTPTQQ